MMDKKLLIKMINTLYFEKTLAPKQSKQDFAAWAYDYHMQRFGIKKIAEAKFTQLL